MMPSSTNSHVSLDADGSVYLHTTSSSVVDVRAINNINANGDAGAMLLRSARARESTQVFEIGDRLRNYLSMVPHVIQFKRLFRLTNSAI